MKDIEGASASRVEMSGFKQLAVEGVLLGINYIPHRGDFFDPEANGRAEPATLATWTDALHHISSKIVKDAFGMQAGDKVRQPEIPLEESNGRIVIGQTSHDWSMFRREGAEVSDTIIFFLNGLTASAEVYKDVAKKMAEEGETTVIAQEGRNLYPNTDRRQYSSPETIASQGAYGVMKEIREKFGDKRFILVGHSMGGATSINATLHMPEWVEHVIHLESTGIDKHNILDMMLRSKDFLADELIPSLPELATRENGVKLGLETLKRTTLRPLRFGLEAIQAGRTDLRPRMEKLRDEVQRIGLVAIQGEDSKFFPIGKVKADGADLYDGIHTHPRPDANHLFPLLFPGSTAKAIKQALNRLAQTKVNLPAEP